MNRKDLDRYAHNLAYCGGILLMVLVFLFVLAALGFAFWHFFAQDAVWFWDRVYYSVWVIIVCIVFFTLMGAVEQGWKKKEKGDGEQR